VRFAFFFRLLRLPALPSIFFRAAVLRLRPPDPVPPIFQPKKMFLLRPHA
jgi:hypothetical protein